MPSPLGAYSAERDNSPQTQIAASRERRAVHRQDIFKHANRIASFQRRAVRSVILGQPARGVQLLVARSEMADREEISRVNCARNSEVNRHTILEPHIPY